jgi:competence protein ComEC
MWWLLSAWIAGDFVFLCSEHGAVFGLLTLAALWCFPQVRRNRLRCLVCLLAGALLSQFFLARHLQDWLPASLSGAVITVTGQVSGLPVSRPSSGSRPACQVFTLAHVRPVEPTAHWPGSHQIKLYDYSGYGHGGYEHGRYEHGAHHYSPGDWVVLRAKLYRPRGLVNRGSTDLARLDLAHGVDAGGSVKALLQQRSGFAPVDRMRDRISYYIRQILKPYPQAAALFPALVVGDWRYLSQSSWQLYQRAGIAHLVVISGEHLTLVAGLVWLLLRFVCVPLLLWCRWPMAAQQWAVLPALLLATGYCLLAGWSVSTLRALLMLTVWFSCRLWRCSWPRNKVLALALLAVLLWQPLSPLSNGFWLSFLAVAMLLLVVEHRPSLVSLQWLMSLTLGALAAFMFSQWGTVGLVANLLLIPVFSFLLVPGALIGSLLPGMGWLLQLMAPVVPIQEELLTRLLALSPSLPIPSTWWIAVLLMLALLLWQVRFLPWPRWSLPFLLLPWLWPASARLAPGDFQTIFFDVGQGQASLVRTRAGLVLYDMGPGWFASDAGSRIVAPWLLKQRQKVLLAFASHGDEDHVGGLDSLRSFIPPQKLFSGEPWRVSGSRACHVGQHWRFAGVDFRVLWPPVGVFLAHDNAYSCVVRVTGRHGSVLLTGDIPRSVEYQLVAESRRPGARLESDVLQLPHHGSATSSSYAFLRAVHPEVALASVGFMNRLHHPSVVVRRKLVQLGIPLLRTDRDGMVTLTMDGSTPFIEAERERSRPWEDRLSDKPWLWMFARNRSVEK